MNFRVFIAFIAGSVIPIAIGFGSQQVEAIMENLKPLKEYQVLCAAFVTFLTAAVSVITIRRTSREKNSLDFEQSYKRDKTIIKCWETVREIGISGVDLSKLDDPKNSRAVNNILNEWERCSNGIQHKVYDEKLLYKAHCSSVVFLYRNYKPYVLGRQVALKSDRILKNFIYLGERWTKRREREERFKKLIKNILISLRLANMNLKLKKRWVAVIAACIFFPGYFYLP